METPGQVAAPVALRGWSSPRVGREPFLTSAIDDLSSLSISPNGAMLAVVSRGQAFALGAFSGPTRALIPAAAAGAAAAAATVAGRARLLTHLADGKRVLLVCDHEGEDSLELHWADGSRTPRTLAGADGIDPEQLGRVESLCPNPQLGGVVVRGPLASQARRTRRVIVTGVFLCEACSRHEIETRAVLVVQALTNGRGELLLLAIPDKDDAEAQEARLQELLGARSGGGGGGGGRKKGGGRVPPGMVRKREITTTQLRRVDCCAHEGGIDGLAWSPCGGWLAYSCSVGYGLATIKLCELRTGSCHALTTPISCDTDPAFDPSGRFLYFLGTRDFEPAYDQQRMQTLSFPRAQRVCLLTLLRDTPSPLLPPPRSPIELDASDSDSDTDAAEDDPEFFDEDGKLYPEFRDKFVQEPAQIDLEGISQRVVSLPVPLGIYDSLVGLSGGRLMWSSYQESSRRVGFGDSATEADSDEEEEEDSGQLCVFNLQTLQSKRLAVEGAVRDLHVSCNGQFMVLVTADEDDEEHVYVARTGERPGSAAQDDDDFDDDDGGDGPEFGPMTGEVDLEGRVILQARPMVEWPQLFHEAWRAVRDGYAEPTLGGVDWCAVRARYEKLLPFASTRAEVADIVEEMLAELGKSHVFEHSADCQTASPAPDMVAGCLGADFVWDSAAAGYRCTHIVRGDTWDAVRGGPLAKPVRRPLRPFWRFD
jgi:hypothetical protein